MVRFFQEKAVAEDRELKRDLKGLHESASPHARFGRCAHRFASEHLVAGQSWLELKGAGTQRARWFWMHGKLDRRGVAEPGSEEEEGHLCGVSLAS